MVIKIAENNVFEMGFLDHNHQIKGSKFKHKLRFYKTKNPARLIVSYKGKTYGGCDNNKESAHNCEKLFNYFSRHCKIEDIGRFFKYASKSEYKVRSKRNQFLKDGTVRYQMLIFRKDNEKQHIGTFNFFEEEYVDSLVTFFVENKGLPIEENILLCSQKYNMKQHKHSNNSQNTLDDLLVDPVAPKQKESPKELLSDLKDVINIIENYDAEVESAKKESEERIDFLESENEFLLNQLKETSSNLKEAVIEKDKLLLEIISKEYDEEQKVLSYFKDPVCEFCNTPMVLKTNEGGNGKRYQGVVYYACEGYKRHHSTDCRNTKSIDNKYIYNANKQAIDSYLRDDHICRGDKYKGKVITRKLPLPSKCYRM